MSSHKEAVESATNGLSTKPDIGFGIKTTKNTLGKGSEGEYSLWSGNARYVKTREKNEIIESPPNTSWDGTFVALRIPINPPSRFTPSTYY